MSFYKYIEEKQKISNIHGQTHEQKEYISDEKLLKLLLCSWAY